MIISDLYKTIITCSDYNFKSSEPSVTVTVYLEDFNKNKVINKSVKLSCNIGYFSKVVGQSTTNFTNQTTKTVTMNTNSAGKIVATYVPNTVGLCTFIANDASVNINIQRDYVWSSTTAINFNTLTTEKDYHITYADMQNSTNAPSKESGGVLKVFQMTTSAIGQLFYNNHLNNEKIWYRSAYINNNSYVFGRWVRIDGQAQTLDLSSSLKFPTTISKNFGWSRKYLILSRVGDMVHGEVTLLSSTVIPTTNASNNSYNEDIVLGNITDSNYIPSSSKFFDIPFTKNSDESQGFRLKIQGGDGAIALSQYGKGKRINGMGSFSYNINTVTY